MDAFSLPFTVCIAGLAWLLVEMIRGSFDDPYPRRAGVVWAVTCPLAGLLFGIGLAPVAVVPGVISLLALGSIGYWFASTEPDDAEGEGELEPDPEPTPSDDMQIEIPAWAQRVDEYDWEKAKKAGTDWDAFDRAREQWERERVPRRRRRVEPAVVPERERELIPA